MDTINWKLNIKVGIYEMELLFDSVGDAVEYIEQTAIHSLADNISYTLKEAKGEE